MTQFYSDPTREPEPYALPDCEVFYRTRKENKADGWLDDEGNPYPSGFYFWFCFPGCLPDSDPEGPYKTEKEAIAAARDMFGE